MNSSNLLYHKYYHTVALYTIDGIEKEKSMVIKHGKAFGLNYNFVDSILYLSKLFTISKAINTHFRKLEKT